MPRLQPRRKPGGGFGGTGGTTGSGKSGGGNAAGRHAGPPPDRIHNGDQPCCQDLALYCRQVLDAVQQQQRQQHDGSGVGSGSSSSSAIPTLPELIAAYLSEAVASMRIAHDPSATTLGAESAYEKSHQHGDTASASKRKRNKKKKKKGKQDVNAASSLASESVADDEGGEDGACGEDGGEDRNNHNGDLEDEHDEGKRTGNGLQGEASASAAVSVASVATDEGKAAPSSSGIPSYSNPTSDFSPPPPPTLFDLMVQDYFSDASKRQKVAPSSPNGSKSTSSSSPPKTVGPPIGNRTAAPTRPPSNPSASHEAFWDRILIESKKFQVTKDAVSSALMHIACERCRRHVADVLEGGHMIQIYAAYDRNSRGGPGGPNPSSYPSLNPGDVSDFHRPSPVPYYSDESYRQLEEGRLDDAAVQWFQEQRHNLSFYYTVCHDDEESMAWKLRGMGLDDDFDDLDNNNNDDDDDEYDCDDTGGNGDSMGGVNGGYKKKKKSAAKGTEPDIAAIKAALRRDGVEDWRKCVLYHYLLGRGVAPNDLLRSTTAVITDQSHNNATVPEPESKQVSIEPDRVEAIASSALRTLWAYQERLNDCAKALKKQEDLVAQHDERYHGHGTGGEYNLAVFPILKAADEECCQTIRLLLQIVSELSQWLFMSATAVRGEEAPFWQQTDLSNLQDAILAMWELWLQATQVIVLEVAHYESFMRKISNRNGQFTSPFSSPTYRDLYRNLVRTKLSATNCFVDQMRDLYDAPLEVPGMNPLDRKASVAMRVVTSGIYCQHFWGIRCDQLPPPTPLDEDMRGVLDSIGDCVETTHRGTWMEVQEEHEKRRQRLSERCDRVVTESNHLGCAGSVIRRLLLGSAHSAQRGVEGDYASYSSETELDPSIRYRESLKEIGMQMVAGWIRERCHQRSNDEPSIPMMPSTLSVRLVNGLREVSCFTNAKTRAACILVSMFYKWMSDHHDAWKAELVAQELLTSLAETEAAPGSDATVVSGTSKAGKKKKKKVIDVLSRQIAPKLGDIDHGPRPPSDKFACIDDPSTAQSDVCDAAGSGEASLASPSPASLEDASMIASTVAAAHGKATSRTHEDEFSMQNGHEAKSIDRKDAAQALELSFSDEVEVERVRVVDSVSALDAFVSVGVHCESSYESAEEFLVRRLVSILKPEAQK